MNTLVLDGSVKPWESSYSTAQTTPSDSVPDYKTYLEPFDTAVDRYPERIAFTFMLPAGFSVDLSYAEFGMQADKLAHYLSGELGLKQGDVVALHMPNCLHYPIVIYAALKAGLALTLVNPLYTPRELLHQLRDSQARVLFGFRLFANSLNDIKDDIDLERIILATPWDFFPEDISGLIKNFLENDQKSVPEVHFDHELFPQALIIGEHQQSQRPQGYQFPAVTPGDTVLIQYTGGTTGVSKGALLSHDNLTAVLQMIMQFSNGAMGEEELEQQTVLTVIPLYHIFAMMLNLTLFTEIGGRNILIPNPSPLENLKPAFEQFKIDVMTGVDTMFAGLLGEQWFTDITPKIKCAITGGTALRSSTSDAWRATVGDIIEGYGLTETACVVAFNPLDGRAKPGSVGLPVPGIGARILDDNGDAVGLNKRGELWVKGPNVTRGYLNLPEESEAAFDGEWFNTGDVVVMDDEGFLRIVDRKKDMILVSGFNVFPNELEDVISSLKGIGDAAVIGIPNQKRGEAPLAIVTRTDSSITEKEVLEHCRLYLTAYKIPVAVEFWEELPKSPVGKILRKNLLAKVQQRNPS